MTRTQFEEFMSSLPLKKSVTRWPDERGYAWRGQYKDYTVQLAYEVVLAWGVYQEGRWKKVRADT